MNAHSVGFYSRMLASPGYLDCMAASGIAPEAFQLLIRDTLFSQSELRAAFGTIQDILHCTESQSGNALVSLPVELVASVIFAFAKPVNWLGLASVCGSLGLRSVQQMALEGTGQSNLGDPDHATHVPPTVSQIVAWLHMLSEIEHAGDSWNKLVNEALKRVGVIGAVDRKAPRRGNG